MHVNRVAGSVTSGRVLVAALMLVSLAVCGTGSAQARTIGYTNAGTTVTPSHSAHIRFERSGVELSGAGAAAPGTSGGVRLPVISGSTRIARSRGTIRHDGALRLRTAGRTVTLRRLTLLRSRRSARLRARVSVRCADSGTACDQRSRTMTIAVLRDVERSVASQNVVLRSRAVLTTRAAHLLNGWMGASALAGGSTLASLETTAARIRTAAGGARKVTVRYGPYEIAPGDHHAGTPMPSDEHMGHTASPAGARQAARVLGTVGHNLVVTDVARPCRSCSITAMVPRLSDTGGAAQNFDTKAMLHHAVLATSARKDATCRYWPERFFAAGNERTPFLLPAGYGYRTTSRDRWSLVTHLMNMADKPRDLYIDVDFTYRRPSGLEKVRPVWLDVAGCGDSEYAIPAGSSATSADWSVNVPGRIVAIGGHLHDDGTHLDVTNESRDGELICRSSAGYGTQPSYKGHIESMSGCLGDPVTTMSSGDTVRITGHYDSKTAQDDVMAIAVGYVAPPD